MSDDTDDDEDPTDETASWVVYLGLGLLPFVPLGLFAAAVIIAKTVRRRRRRALETLPARVDGGWQEILDLLTDMGRAPDPLMTRAEIAAQLQADVPQLGASTLAARADRAVFGPDDLPDAAAEEYWDQVMAARAAPPPPCRGIVGSASRSPCAPSAAARPSDGARTGADGSTPALGRRRRNARKRRGDAAPRCAARPRRPSGGPSGERAVPHEPDQILRHLRDACCPKGPRSAASAVRATRPRPTRSGPPTRPAPGRRRPSPAPGRSRGRSGPTRRTRGSSSSRPTPSARPSRERPRRGARNSTIG
ncbi:hypothetical protein [Brachybacterium sp. GPGPB12]|uniref:hypothetical protein n=1 Tax=Brachybacterium sp. GPGPB12 TaxID=3023517 RepID=UPI0031342771